MYAPERKPLTASVTAVSIKSIFSVGKFPDLKSWAFKYCLPSSIPSLIPDLINLPPIPFKYLELVFLFKARLA